MKQKVTTVEKLEDQRCLVQVKNSKIIVLKHEGQFLAMDAICPHSGGPLYLGDIEDLGECTLVCPWHAYRFSFKDGKSLDDEIFSTNVYPVFEEDGELWMELEPIESISHFKHCSKTVRPPKTESAVQDTSHFTLTDWAIYILNTPDPQEKVDRTFQAAELWFDDKLEIGHSDKTPDRPARHEQLEVVDRSKTKKRGRGGTVESRIAILHALANVEQWAIDLAWDIISRYSASVFTSPDGVQHTIPRGFFDDFVQVAREEATHFSYLVERIQDMGGYYGSLPVHDGLWDSAVLTSSSLESRLAIVHMVHEARGLDVNPSTIQKFE
jgi:uncharacterized ferritin-like protein (DUF455 family)/nitrite reductase/ring-hydroxylating ferredoxin subunit